MKIKNLIYIILACYLGTFLRLSINNNFVISILGSFFVGFFVNKRLSYSQEKILLSGFFIALHPLVDFYNFFKFNHHHKSIHNVFRFLNQ